MIQRSKGLKIIGNGVMAIGGGVGGGGIYGFLLYDLPLAWASLALACGLLLIGLGVLLGGDIRSNKREDGQDSN